MTVSKREGTSWMITLVLAICGGIGAYHVYMNSIHEPAGVAQAVAVEAKTNTVAVILRMESDNQNLRNHYNGVLEDCEAAKLDAEVRNCSLERVQDAKAQLDRLDYNRNATVELKHSVVGSKAE